MVRVPVGGDMLPKTCTVGFPPELDGPAASRMVRVASRVGIFRSIAVSYARQLIPSGLPSQLANMVGVLYKTSAAQRSESSILVTRRYSRRRPGAARPRCSSPAAHCAVLVAIERTPCRPGLSLPVPRWRVQPSRSTASWGFGIVQFFRNRAERGGFEPPIRLPVCRISSAVHSTTLPPLRTPWSSRTSITKHATIQRISQRPSCAEAHTPGPA